MSPPLTDIIQRVLAKAPAWIRQELMSNDAATRRRAEDALAAMIAAALAEAEQECAPA